MHLFLANCPGLLTGRLGDDRCGTSHELSWQIIQSQPCGSVPQPLLFLGPVSQKGLGGRGELRKREMMPLVLLDIALLFWCSGPSEHQIYTEGSAQSRARRAELEGVGSCSDAGEYCGQTEKHPPVG